MTPAIQNYRHPRYLRQVGLDLGSARLRGHVRQSDDHSCGVQMLSIRFGTDHEWWVSGRVFERLFLSALEHGQLAPSLEEWRHMADANGGLSFGEDEQDAACELIAGLRAAAIAELEQLRDADLHTQDGTYKVSLEKLLAVTDAVKL